MTRLEQKGFWSKEVFARPFSVELVRPDFSLIEVLLFLNKDLFNLSKPLMEDLDEELGVFMDSLLGEKK